MRSPLRRFEVAGESMLPTLRPGDRVVVWTGARIRVDDVVVACHPRDPAQLIVKRVVHRTEDGWWLESDNQGAAGRQDSWDFDAVPDRLILGRAVARYRLTSPLRISASALSRRRAG
jgi:nickel-type superoxide dismutase maturation protease